MVPPAYSSAFPAAVAPCDKDGCLASVLSLRRGLPRGQAGGEILFQARRRERRERRSLVTKRTIGADRISEPIIFYKTNPNSPEFNWIILASPKNSSLASTVPDLGRSGQVPNLPSVLVPWWLNARPRCDSVSAALKRSWRVPSSSRVLRNRDLEDSGDVCSKHPAKRWLLSFSSPPLGEITEREAGCEILFQQPARTTGPVTSRFIPDSPASPRIAPHPERVSDKHFSRTVASSNQDTRGPIGTASRRERNLPHL